MRLKDFFSAIFKPTATEALVEGVQKSRVAEDVLDKIAQAPNDGSISGASLIMAAVEKDSPQILDAVVGKFAQGNFSSIVYTHAYSPMGAVVTGKYDVLGYAMSLGSREVIGHLLQKPFVVPSQEHLRYALENNMTDVAEKIMIKLRHVPQGQNLTP